MLSAMVRRERISRSTTSGIGVFSGLFLKVSLEFRRRYISLLDMPKELPLL